MSIEQLFLPVLYFGVDFSGIIGPFVRFWILIGMFIAVMLPIFAIPYIFIKMGSVAGQVQAKVSSARRSAQRTATGAAKGAAKGAGARAWQNKSAQWAARGDGSLRSKIGGYQAQRDYKRKANASEAHRMQESAIRAKLLNKSDPYAASVAGPGGAQALATVRANAQLAEQKASIERTNARQAEFQVLGTSSGALRKMHTEFLQQGDVEGANAALNQMMQQGAGGRQDAARALEEINNPSNNIPMTEDMANKINQNIFANHSGAAGSRGDIGKGSMTTKQDQSGETTIQWGAKDLNTLSISQLATQDPETISDFEAKGGKISPELAHRIVNDVNIKSTVHQDVLVKFEKAAANYNPSSGGGIITPSNTTAKPNQTQTQQQRQQGGNFNGGPGQNQ